MDAEEYYKTRLEHTLKHIHEATKLIYLVDGGILAMVYFVLEKENPAGGIQKGAAIVLFLFLGLINVIHARFLSRQIEWYYSFDNAWLELVGRTRLELPRSRAKYKIVAHFQDLRSGRLYVILHWSIAAGAIIAAIATTML